MLAGDFNAGWVEGEAMRALCERLALTVWKPEAPLIIIPGFDVRLDWVAVSAELRIVGHHIADEVVSDHRAVAVDLVWDGD